MTNRSDPFWNRDYSSSSNNELSFYIVTLNEEKGDLFRLAFECHATDADDAADQALAAYPDGVVLHVRKGALDD